MNHAHKLQHLFKQAYLNQKKQGGSDAASLIPFLAVPIRERLILLAQLDGAGMVEIKAAFPWAKETDVRRSSHRMIAAEQILQASFNDHWGWVNPGPIQAVDTGDLGFAITRLPFPTRLIPDNTDVQLRQIFYAEVPIMLFGAAVPAAVARLSLQQRAIIYLIAVQEYKWADVQELLECTEWSIRRAIKDAEQALGGI